MRYFIGFLVMIGLIILLVVLLVGGNGKPKNAPKSLVSYANTSAQVRMTIDGPVNAVSEHEQVRITVDKNNVTYEQLKGYDGDVVNSQIFANTESAYDVFLHALQHAGYTHGDNNPDLKDERGYCPLNDRYIYEIIQDGNTIQRYWTSNCGSPKTYLGNRNLTNTLFERQVPGYTSLTSGLQL